MYFPGYRIFSPYIPCPPPRSTHNGSYIQNAPFAVHAHVWQTLPSYPSGVMIAGSEQDFDPQAFESLKWMMANTGARDWGFHFEDIGQPDKVRHVEQTISASCVSWRVAKTI